MAAIVANLCYIALFILSNVGRVHLTFQTQCTFVKSAGHGSDKLPLDGSPYLLCVDIEVAPGHEKEIALGGIDPEFMIPIGRKGFDLGREHGAGHGSKERGHGVGGGGADRGRRRSKRVGHGAGHDSRRREHGHGKELVGRKSARRNGEGHRNRRHGAGYRVDGGNRRNYRVGYGAGYGYTGSRYAVGGTGYSVVPGRNMPAPTSMGVNTNQPNYQSGTPGYGAGVPNQRNFGNFNPSQFPVIQSHSQATGENAEAVANAFRETGQGEVLANSIVQGQGGQSSSIATNQLIGGASAHTHGYGTSVNSGSFANSQNVGNAQANTVVNGAMTNALGQSQANQGNAISQVQATGLGTTGQANSNSMSGIASSTVAAEGSNAKGVSTANSGGPLAQSYTNVAGANSIGTATSHNLGSGLSVANVVASGHGSSAVATALGRKSRLIRMSRLTDMNSSPSYFSQGRGYGNNVGRYTISYGSGIAFTPPEPPILV